MTWALPNSCKDLLDAVNIKDRHPGLQLDKFSDGGSQRDLQRPALDLVTKTTGNEDALHAFGERRRNMLRAVQANQFSAKTTGPLTLHLSRASALENAGICLHPLLGFVYLPGSGLKGMARAWAETAWLAEQNDKSGSIARIERIFGNRNCAGSVVFHDAWPQSWPKLVVDILNNHHREYYQGTGQPGDWEAPVPVNFLAIEKGQAFDFALSLRHGCADDIELLALAQQWLHAALCLRGAGAKTNAGYGAFAPAPQLAQPVLPQHEACFAARLTLTSPGFFAGAQQDGTDCDLRPASLRGQLRWWWRALHAGFLPLADLKRLEALLWGSTERSGMLRISLDANMMNTRAMSYDRQREILGLPKPPAKTVQGLHYVTYGMNDGGSNRSFAKPGSSWDLTITARSTGANISAQQALRHAQVAVWLFTHYGGLGSKARKGFGSFADVDVEGLDSIEDCQTFLGLAGDHIETPAPDIRKTIELNLHASWPLGANVTWQKVLDRAGSALQTTKVDQKNASRNTAHLGLPRGRKQNERHAAPYVMHLGKTQNDEPIFRFLGLPSGALPERDAPDIKTNKLVLEALQAELGKAMGSSIGGGRQRPGGRPSAPRAGDRGHDTGNDEDVTIVSVQGKMLTVRYDDGGEDQISISNFQKF